MKKFFMLCTVCLVFFTVENSLSQTKLEFSGGYIHSLNQENIFAHTKDGFQGSVAVIQPLSETINFTGRIIYQSRSFDEKSFSFIVPLVVGYPIPVVTNGDDLKSYGVLIGLRLSSNRYEFVNTFISTEAGLIYHSDSYYELNNSVNMKYVNSKTLFEYSFGIGLNFRISEGYSLNLEGKMSHIPSEGIVYFPINLGIMIPF